MDASAIPLTLLVDASSQLERCKRGRGYNENFIKFIDQSRNEAHANQETTDITDNTNGKRESNISFHPCYQWYPW